MIDAVAQAGIMALEFILCAMTDDKDEDSKEVLSPDDCLDDQAKEISSVDKAAGSSKDHS